MQAVIFIGIQASGKSTFYLQHFFLSHVRINLDMLKTRYREKHLLETCLDIKQPFVIDNTNPKVEDRKRYIVPAKRHSFQVIGYYFQSKVADSILRNEDREGKQKIPEKGIRGTYARLVVPQYNEGFDELHYVQIAQGGQFTVEEWVNEV